MTDSMPLRVASAQYPIQFLNGWDHYARKITDMVAAAAGQGAQLLVMPEYAAMELASLLPGKLRSRPAAQMAALQEYLAPFLELHQALAREHRIYILAGSFPVRLANRAYRNRAHFFAPDGSSDFQDKLQLTRYESEQQLLQPGDAIKVFETGLGRIGVAICYDSEFPLIVRRQTEAGAALILVPSCTDTLAGFHRVHVSCRARALENQCYVVQSPTVGEAAWSETVDVNVGCAGVFTPVDRGFPEDGVLAQGEMNIPQMVYADLHLEYIQDVRSNGQVLNYRDWDRQTAIAAMELWTITL